MTAPAVEQIDQVPSPTGYWWADLLLVSAAVATAVGVLWRPVRGSVRVARRLDTFLRDWAGEEPRPGFQGRPGVMERLDRIESEVRANGGGSLRDRVDEIERMVQQIK